MRHIRWKNKYLTGDPASDERNRSLVALVSDLGHELGRKEHCQDMNELYAELVQITARRLETMADEPAAATESDAKLGEMLRNGFPLAARSTPACKECGLCDLMEERMRDWLPAENQ